MMEGDWEIGTFSEVLDSNETSYLVTRKIMLCSLGIAIFTHHFPFAIEGKPSSKNV